MKVAQAKKHLSRTLNSFTVGAVLHLLAELFKESAVRAKDAGDELAHEGANEVATALYVFGLGVEAASPRTTYFP